MSDSIENDNFPSLDSLETDQEGYLIDPSLWSMAIAHQIAKKEKLDMSDDHWLVVDYVRQFYDEFQTSPSIRPLVKYLERNWGKEKGNSLYLYKLFPKGPAKQATKIAGLTKPKRCI